jgi:hypothetical protein
MAVTAKPSRVGSTSKLRCRRSIPETAFVREGSRCLFAGLVDIIGLDALDEAGVTPQELAQGDNLPAVGLEISERQAREAADVFFGCFDVADLFILFEHSEKDGECIRSAIKNSDNELREVMKEDLLGSDETDFTEEISQLLGDQCDVSIYAD